MDKSIDVASEDAPIVRLCTRILTEAVKMRASDIHIEPMADRIRLRYRIDGVCIVRDNLPKRMQNAVLSRVKLMSGVNISEKRVPQDGRIKLPLEEGNVVDFRVSACPAYHGESVVLRILRSDAVKIGLVNLGFEEDNLAVFNKIIRRPNGIFLVTGPTGSGKTTTLYSALDVLNRPDKAALTGHLVFSTLHTNDAPSAITRLIDMGVKPFLVASAIQAIMAQRLIRMLCKECKALDPDPDHKFLRLTGITPEEAAGKVYKPVGCSVCNGTGFKGRKAIFEMMLMSSEIRELAFSQAPIAKIRHAAIAGGMRPLVEDGKIKILKGATAPAEIAAQAQVEGIVEMMEEDN